MIELVSASIVDADDALLHWADAAAHPWARRSRCAALAHALQCSEPSVRAKFAVAPGAILGEARQAGPAAMLAYVALLSEAMLDVTLELARVRKSQGKTLLTYQAVALRVANLYLALLGVDQAVADSRQGTGPASGDGCDPQRVADLLLTILRNAAQVLAGHGFVDNERFAALHQAALDSAHILLGGDGDE